MKGGSFLKRPGVNCGSTSQRLLSSQVTKSAARSARYCGNGVPLPWNGCICRGEHVVKERQLNCFHLFQILEREGEENEALHKMIANEQKASLPNLFQDKNRPCLSNWPEVPWLPQRGKKSHDFKGLSQKYFRSSQPSPFSHPFLIGRYTSSPFPFYCTAWVGDTFICVVNSVVHTGYGHSDLWPQQCGRLQEDCVLCSEFEDNLSYLASYMTTWIWKRKSPWHFKGRRGEIKLTHYVCTSCFQDTDTLYIVSHFFLDEWRKFVR